MYSKTFHLNDDERSYSDLPDVNTTLIKEANLYTKLNDYKNRSCGQLIKILAFIIPIVYFKLEILPGPIDFLRNHGFCELLLLSGRMT